MTFNDIRAAIENRFINNWVYTNKNTHVEYPNQEFKEPESGVWVSLNILFTPSRNATISGSGTRRIRKQGIIICDINSKVDTGTKNSLDAVDAFHDLFENKQFNDIQCLAGSVSDIGLPSARGVKPQLHRYRASVPFYIYTS